MAVSAWGSNCALLLLVKWKWSAFKIEWKVSFGLGGPNDKDKLPNNIARILWDLAGPRFWGTDNPDDKHMRGAYHVRRNPIHPPMRRGMDASRIRKKPKLRIRSARQEPTYVRSATSGHRARETTGDKRADKLQVKIGRRNAAGGEVWGMRVTSVKLQKIEEKRRKIGASDHASVESGSRECMSLRSGRRRARGGTESTRNHAWTRWWRGVEWEQKNYRKAAPKEMHTTENGRSAAGSKSRQWVYLPQFGPS
ncbi:hypothetical protein B0H19DRAFT_1065256 [Mycena capillaripes]|nr:hypothetical protein B0H19DRAFT_1065256 [Mycena capillaripes]